MAKKKKNSREKRALVGAVCTAAVILAGSTFAWFTSQDEVTNRLTATADYGVSIVEDFKPPEQPLTPGQSVNKDVSAVNTGNIDAFVRLALQNVLDITTVDSKALTISVANGTATNSYQVQKVTTVVTDVAAGNYFGDDTADPVVPPISVTATYATETAADSVASALEGADNTASDGVTITYAAVETVEDSGIYKIQKTTVTTEILPTVYANTTEANAAATSATDSNHPEIVYSVYDASTTSKTATVNKIGDLDLGTGESLVKLSTNQSTNFSTGKITPNEVTTLQAGGMLVMAGSQILPKSAQIVVSGDDTTATAQKDYNGKGQYTPDHGEGLYIFRRTDYAGAAGNVTKYSGYYYKDGEYYALKTETNGTNSTVYIDFGTDGGIELDADGQIIDIDGVSMLTHVKHEDADLTYTVGKLTEAANANDTFAPYSNTQTTINAIRVLYDNGDNDTIFYIKLDANWTDSWTYVAPTSDVATDKVADWFYLSKLLKSGDTSPKLVDSIKLSNTVTNQCFVDLTYDLNVILQSVQVSYNEEGDQTADAVPTDTWAEKAVVTNATNSDGTVSKITEITWSSGGAVYAES